MIVIRRVVPGGGCLGLVRFVAASSVAIARAVGLTGAVGRVLVVVVGGDGCRVVRGRESGHRWGDWLRGWLGFGEELNTRWLLLPTTAVLVLGQHDGSCWRLLLSLEVVPAVAIVVFAGGCALLVEWLACIAARRWRLDNRRVVSWLLLLSLLR